MFLENIELSNFRLHKNTVFNFSQSLNFIVGGNAQGKTTVLESIHLVSTTKSFSQNSDREIVSFGEDNFRINSKVKDIIEDNIVIQFNTLNNKKQYAINGKIVDRPSEIIGKYPIVFLSPQDLFVTEGSPSDRRKFFDSIISQYSKTYLLDLLEYKKILRQRISLLNQIKETGNTALNLELEIWTNRLIEIGSKIIRFRKIFLDEFKSYLNKAFAFIRSDIEQADILYQTQVLNESEEIEKIFKEKIDENKYIEIRRATNLIGPHKDDFIFTINKINLKDFGSQGEHKTFQVALRFAEYFYLKDKLNKKPIFLLDDVFGDLDKNRGNRISEFLRDLGQAFITLTDFTNLKEIKRSPDDNIISINNSQISYVK